MAGLEELLLKAKGLATFADKFSAVPEGSLSVATNIVIDKDGLMSPRRGYQTLPNTSTLGYIESLHTYSGLVWAHRDNLGGTTANTLSSFDGATWSDLATAVSTPTDVNKLRSIQFAKNIYFASDKGVQKLDSPTGDVIDSGAPEGIAPAIADAGVSGAAIPASSDPGAKDVAVAYRIVWGYKDANENLILGAPSSRAVYSHSRLTIRDVNLTIPVPAKLTEAWFYQVYRSKSLEYPNHTPEVPSDELFLVFEGNPTADNLTGVTPLVHTDSQPETLLGTALYTNATQDGILQSNFVPPKCTDMAIYQNHAFFSNTETKYSQEFQLLSAGAPELQPGDVITVNSIDYTAVTPGTKEVTSILAAAGSTLADGEYFSMYDSLSQVLFWLDLDYDEEAEFTIPPAIQTLVDGGARAVRIKTVKATHSIGDVGSLVGIAIRDDLGFETVSDDLAGTVVVRSLTYGTKVDSADVNTGFTVTKVTDGVASPALSDGDFRVSDNLSVFAQIEESAKDLVRAMNEDPRTNASDIVAYYDSDTSPTSTDLPGKIRVVESDFAVATAFEVIATATGDLENIWLPSLVTAEVAKNEAKLNRIFFSKELQAEAVPVNNFFDVGAANDKILRILPLRTALLIFTEAGIYKLSGVSQSSFQVTLLDNTAKLLAADSAVVLENNVYGLFDQGVCKISESVVVLSRPIEGALLQLRGLLGDDISYSFGIGYESDRKYMLFMSSETSDTVPDIGFVYNVVTETWTTSDISKTFGIVNPKDDRVYFCDTDNVAKERKDFVESDIADEQIEFTPMSITDNVITVTNPVAVQIRVGDLFFQSDTAFSVISAVDTTANTITVEDNLAYTIMPSEIRRYIFTEIVWNPVFAEKPSSLKQFSEVTLLTSKPVRSSQLGFKTIQSPHLETVTLSSGSGGSWGLFAWGEVNWGGDVGLTNYRTYVPRLKQRDSALILSLTQNTVYDNFEISGFSLIYRMIGSRTGR